MCTAIHLSISPSHLPLLLHFCHLAKTHWHTIRSSIATAVIISMDRLPLVYFPNILCYFHYFLSPLIILEVMWVRTKNYECHSKTPLWATTHPILLHNVYKGNLLGPEKINPLLPNDIYIYHTAPLTSRCCILNVYSTNIRTEYFKHAA
jgi:hypothetical protein